MCIRIALLVAAIHGFSVPRATVVAPAARAVARHQRLQPPRLSPLGEAVAVNTGLAVVGVATGATARALTPAGLVHAYALGVILLSSFVGWRGYGLCVLYLVGGSLATSVKKKEKEAAGIGEGRGGRRGPENVWGSAATAAGCALLGGVATGKRPLLALAFVASLATKLSDTLASEIGKAYGKTCYLSTTLARVPPGTEGAVSLEGTVAGFFGSAVVAAAGAAVGLISWRPGVAIACGAAFVATTCESWLGATAQGGWLTNEVINFVNTLIGALVAYAAGSVL
jgi:uncharacterized protein (TIGR00297 family)